ncbi:glycerate kinase [Galbitalea soli]|uniref:Glycerate kinase n=1 Tax=Galbitalea soli TaxID=1268042 RepID=A0A7C9TUL3_9MICO|nr:glycerate kinase [Galbitalea soli]NYJ29437.1 glycerate kinase [Galbitalea soli]
MPHTVVIAPDSFKGSLAAGEVAEALADGWRSVRSSDRLVLLPQADGGEGTLDAVEASSPGAERVAVGLVTGPDGRPTQGEWLRLADGTAVVELAQMSGLPLMQRLDAAGATTVGLGQVLRAAVAAGAPRVVVALGGSASTDGGAGALVALGARLLDARHAELDRGGASLARLASIDLTALVAAPAGGVVLLTDVTSPLLGPDGAAAVFGPQKGASPDDVDRLDAALGRFATVLGGHPEAPGAGAAGGTAFGLASAWGAGMRAGADYVAELTGLPAALHDASIVITGEGRFDSQSFAGKVVGRVLARAAERAVPVAVVAGQDSVRDWPSALPIAARLDLVTLAGSTEAAMADARRWLHAAGARLAREHTPD